MKAKYYCNIEDDTFLIFTEIRLAQMYLILKDLEQEHIELVIDPSSIEGKIRYFDKYLFIQYLKQELADTYDPDSRFFQNYSSWGVRYLQDYIKELEG